MARFSDGSNRNMTTPSDTVPGLDNNDISIAFWFMKGTQPAAQQFIMLTQTATGGGSARYRLTSEAPGTSGFRVQFFCAFSGTNGLWTTSNDLSLNTPYHIAVTYNRSATTNDPTIYVNGASVAITETLTPVGTAATGGDSLKFWESASGVANDGEGTMSHFWAQGGIILDAAAVNRAKSWGRPQGGGHVYYPFVTDKLTNEGSDTGGTLTNSGTTMVAFPVPVIRPGTMAMTGMAGW